MLKKLILPLALLLSLSTTAFANFYAGGSLGISMLEARESTSVPPESHRLGGYGFIGGGFLGYNFCCSCWDLGVEGFIYGNTTEDRVLHHQTGTELSVSNRYNWGFRVLPGYVWCNDVETHLIAGYTRGNFRLKDDGVYGFVNDNFNVNGYQVGAGATLPLSCALSLRLDGVFSGYSSESVQAIATTGALDTYTIRPRTFDATLSLIYNF